MRFTYSPPADALYVEFAAAGEGQAVENRELASGIVADYDVAGRLLGIEVLGASRFIPLEQLHQAESPVVWLTLAEAATEAAKLGEPITATTMRVQLMNGKLKGEKRGRDWVIARHELVNYLENRAPSGRRAKPPARKRRAKAGARRSASSRKGSRAPAGRA